MEEGVSSYVYMGFSQLDIEDLAITLHCRNVPVASVFSKWMKDSILNEELYKYDTLTNT